MISFIRILTAAVAALVFTLSAHAASVDVNKATQTELESVKGIGPGMSAKILKERKKSAFKDWNDLVDRVQGVGPGNAAKLSAQGLTLNGAAYSAGATTVAGHAKRKGTTPTAQGVITTTSNTTPTAKTSAKPGEAEAKPAARK